MNSSAPAAPVAAPSVPIAAPTTSHGGQHVCPVCSKQFTRPSTLATHMNIHKSATSYVCGVHGCSSRFDARTSATRHRYLHGATFAQREIAVSAGSTAAAATAAVGGGGTGLSLLSEPVSRMRGGGAEAGLSEVGTSAMANMVSTHATTADTAESSTTARAEQDAGDAGEGDEVEGESSTRWTPGQDQARLHPWGQAASRIASSYHGPMPGATRATSAMSGDADVTAASSASDCASSTGDAASALCGRIGE